MLPDYDYQPCSIRINRPDGTWFKNPQFPSEASISRRNENIEKTSSLAFKRLREMEGASKSLTISSSSKETILSLIREVTSSKARISSEAESKDLCKQIEDCATFEEALLLASRHHSSPNEYVYSAFLKKADSFEALKGLFDSIPKEFKNSVIYNIYIIASGDFKQFQEVEAAFRNALDLNLDDPFVYSAYFTACGVNDKFQNAKTLFQKKNNSFFDDYTISTYIKAAGKCGELQEIENGIIKAKKLNLFTSSVLNSSIKAYGKNNEFANAKNLFETHLPCRNDLTFSYYIEICGFNGEYGEAKEKLDLAIRLNIANPYHFSAYILGCNRFPESKYGYDKAIELGHANIIVRNCYIKVLGKNRKFLEAQRIYKDSLHQNHSNPITHCEYIYACGKNRKIEELKEALKTAERLKSLNPYVFNCYLAACIKNNYTMEGREAFTLANNLKLANALLYHQYFLLFSRKHFFDGTHVQPHGQ